MFTHSYLSLLSDWIRRVSSI